MNIFQKKFSWRKLFFLSKFLLHVSGCRNHNYCMIFNEYHLLTVKLSLHIILYGRLLKAINKSKPILLQLIHLSLCLVIQTALLAFEGIFSHKKLLYVYIDIYYDCPSSRVFISCPTFTLSSLFREAGVHSLKWTTQKWQSAVFGV